MSLAFYRIQSKDKGSGPQPTSARDPARHIPGPARLSESDVRVGFSPPIGYNKEE
jgi:hypothetical protein